MRSRWDMIHDILRTIRSENGKLNKAEIAPKAGMRWESLCKYHDILIHQGLIVASPKTYLYKLTRKGVRALKGIEKLNNMLK